MTLKLNGSSSGHVNLDAKAAAASNTLTLPDTANGELVAADSSGHINLADNKEIKLGTGGDLVLTHDGSHSYIKDTGTGILSLNGDQITLHNASGSEIMLQAVENGAVSLYYDSNKTFETLAAGAKVNVATAATAEFGIQAASSQNAELWLLSDAGNQYGDKVRLLQDDGTLSIDFNTAANTWENSAKFVANGACELYHDNSKKFETKSDGVEMFGTVTSTGNRNSPYAFHAHSTTSTSNQYYITFTRDDDTSDGYIASTTDGQIFLANGSDYRMKENIVSMTNGIDIVKKLNPVTFKFKGQTDTIQGFIAHEVADAGVLHAVIGTKDAVDSDDNPVHQGLGTEKIIPSLTAALKEAITKIETLETKVAALEGS